MALPAPIEHGGTLLSYHPNYLSKYNEGALGELILPNPLEAALEISRDIRNSLYPLVYIIHSEAMCAGKTETCINTANILGSSKLLSFQPAAGIRFGEEQEVAVMSRNGSKIPALTIPDNNLFSIIEHIRKNKIKPEDFPYLLIDEGMLFVSHAGKSYEAIIALESLRLDGFAVLINGIDYTFQEIPFTFMHDLLRRTTTEEAWRHCLLATQCVFCDRRARGSMRLITNNDGITRIASYNDTQFQAGDNYMPVCCVEHHSCVDLPEGFERPDILTILKN